MNTNVIPFDTRQLPAAAQNRLANNKGIAKHMAEGVGAPMDLLSIKGKNFTERVGGEVVPTARPNYEFDVVILDATANISKTYYATQYVDGAMDNPDCWSLNGIKPDPQAPAIQSPTCRGCRWNVFGSRIMPDRAGQQSRAKACQDNRRVAVMPAYKLAPPDGSDPNPMLLRIPATSLAPLKVYAETLERLGIPVNAVVTRLGFVQGVSHPQLTFAVVNPLNDDQFGHVEWLLRPDPLDGSKFEDERIRRILEAPPTPDDLDPSEFSGQVITNRNQAGAAQPTAAAPATGAAWSPGAQAKAEAAFDVILDLLDGRRFNQTKGVFVEEAKPARPATVIELPDGKLYDPVTKQYWQDDVAPRATSEPAKPISERAKAVPPAGAPAGQAGAPQTGWKPAAAAQPAQPAKASWRPSQANGPVIQGEVIEMKEDEAKPEAPATPKKRRPAPPAGDQSAVAQEAPASLDALLNGLELDKK